MDNRVDELVGGILRRIREAIVEHDLTYDEFQALKQWLIEVGEAGEWPLFLDVYVESAVEQHVFRDRTGSDGTILGPFHLPGAPVLEPPFELPRRDDERGDRLVFFGRVLSLEGEPLGGAELDVWHADADGLYSGFAPGVPEGILRGKVLSGDDGRFEVRTILPGDYSIPLEGPTGRMTTAAGWSPWRPAHLHTIVSAEGYEQLVTQLFIDTSDYLHNDVADAVKDPLIVGTRLDEHAPDLSLEYDFTLAPARSPSPVG